ncbi:MAG: hypothetical protein ACI9VX_000846 [Dinoroseobacter sp.]|jgi:hypothetical protein
MMRILLACLAIALCVTGAPLANSTARLNYVTDATFLIEAPDGTTMATDYTGFPGNTDHIPTFVTMSNAHGTHFTSSPDPRIPHVLRGWGGGTRPADHVVMAPVRWFNQFGLDRFLGGKSDAFAIEVTGNSYTEVSLRTFPDRPRVRVLAPTWVRYAV